MNPYCLYTHNALQRTVYYGGVIVSRNLERTNKNGGFKMTALEISMIGTIMVAPPFYNAISRE